MFLNSAGGAKKKKKERRSCSVVLVSSPVSPLRFQDDAVLVGLVNPVVSFKGVKEARLRFRQGCF